MNSREVHSTEEYAPNGDGMLTVQLEEPLDPPVQGTDRERLMIEGVQLIVETIIEPMPEVTAQLAQCPIEQVAEELAAELMKELDILPAPVAEVTAIVPGASAANSMTASTMEGPGPRPEIGTSGSPHRKQTNKVVLMAENLFCKLITWKEGVDAEQAMERKAPELQQ
jgi:hypothetical protein